MAKKKAVNAPYRVIETKKKKKRFGKLRINHDIKDYNKELNELKEGMD